MAEGDQTFLASILDRLDRIEAQGRKSSKKFNREIRGLKDRVRDDGKSLRRELRGDEDISDKPKRDKKKDKAKPNATSTPNPAEATASAPQAGFEELLSSLPAEARQQVESKLAAWSAETREALASLLPLVAARPEPNAAPGAGTPPAAPVGGGRGPGPARVPTIVRPRSQEEYARLDKAQRDALTADPLFDFSELPIAVRA